MRLDAIDQRCVDAWRIELANKYAPASTNQMLKALSSILRNAVEHGLIATRPKSKRVKVPVRPVSFFTYGEADRLVAACDDDVRTMVVVALKTGLRIGELTALRWANVDLDGATLHVRENYVRGRTGTPKSGRSRDVPLTPTR